MINISLVYRSERGISQGRFTNYQFWIAFPEKKKTHKKNQQICGIP